MKEYTILFLVGKDRPGIVDDVSTFLFERGANIEDSRMAVMGGCFSIMTLFSCLPQKLEGIEGSLSELREMGFETSLHRAQAPEAVSDAPDFPMKVAVTSMDHPGIVRKVVRILRRHNVNVRSMITRMTSAPLSGAPIFNLVLEAALPSENDVSKVREDLEDLADRMNMDLNFPSAGTDKET